MVFGRTIYDNQIEKKKDEYFGIIYCGLLSVVMVTQVVFCTWILYQLSYPLLFYLKLSVQANHVAGVCDLLDIKIVVDASTSQA